MTTQLIERPVTSDPGPDDDDLIHVVCEVCWPGDEKVALCSLDVTDARSVQDIPEEDVCIVCRELAAGGRCPVCKYGVFD